MPLELRREAPGRVADACAAEHVAVDSAPPQVGPPARVGVELAAVEFGGGFDHGEVVRRRLPRPPSGGQ